MSTEVETGTHRTEKTSLTKIKDAVYQFLSKEKVLGALTIGPAIILYIIVSLVPIGWAFAASFHEVGAFSPTWEFVGLDNYFAVIDDPKFIKSNFTGAVFAGGSVLVQVIFGVGFALVLNKEFKYNRIVRAIGLTPYLIPTVIVGFLALWMSNQQWGVINRLLLDAGMIEHGIAWFSRPDTVMPALVLTNSWKFSIFVTIMVLARLQGIPEGFYEAASMAGATPFQKFRDITLPNIKNILFIVVLLRGVWMFNKFDIIWSLTRGGPAGATTTVPVYAYNQAFQSYSLGRASAVSVLLFLLLVVAAILYFRVFKPSEEVRVE